MINIKNYYKIIIKVYSIFIFISIFNGYCWSTKGHYFITYHAFYYLPKASILNIFKKDIIKRSSEPDFLKENSYNEGYGHFINLDKYDKPPFNNIPINYDEFLKKYPSRTIRKAGILPWRIKEWYKKLCIALKEKNRSDIIRAAAYIAHYCEDSCVPFHATKNFNGQYTGNRGIHARFETILFNKMKRKIIFPPKYSIKLIKFKDPVVLILHNSYESWKYVDEILRADTKATEKSGFGFYGKYYVYMEKYVGKILEKRIIKAAILAASIWNQAEIDSKSNERK